MKKMTVILGAIVLLSTSITYADVKSDFKDINFILSSENVLSKIKPTQKLESIVRKGESFDIRLINSDGSCEQYNAMVLGGISNTGSFFQESVIDELPEVCN